MAAQLARPDFYDKKNKFSCEDSEDSGARIALIHFLKLRPCKPLHLTWAQKELRY